MNQRAPISNSRRRAKSGPALCLFGLLLPVVAQGQAPAPESRFYYAIENLDNGQVVRRGKTTQAGIPQGDLILAPETRYREWLLQADNGFIGFTDFRTPQSGQRFTVPFISLGQPLSPDSDHDGLSDDAEFVVGTSPTNPDTDGDGIKDGAAIGLGLDPGAAARTGIIGSANSPGTAVDICAINDMAIVAESDRGITVFNIFNRMNPLVIAQVDTPGTAQRVACSGNRIAVADGAAGLAIIDITDPPVARIVHQLSLAGAAQAVTSAGGIGYVGLSSGRLVSVDLTSGTILEQITLNTAVQDLAIEADTLYALTGTTLYSLALDGLGLRVIGSIGLPGGRRLFVGGAVAYVSQSQGYSTFNVANPAQMSLIRTTGTGTFWGQIVANGSGWALATLGALGGPDDVSLYDIRNLSVPGLFVTTFTTPGRAASVSIFNGLGYAADGNAGLQVINYLGFDTSNRPPTITLSASFAISDGTNGVAEEGKLVRVSASVSDDIQVRNVDVYVDGGKAATDGNFPFEHRFTTPALARQRSFRLQARASDTGGNFTWSETIVVQLIPDATPPYVVRTFPTAGAIVGSVNLLAAYFSEPIAPASLTAVAFQIRSAGPNGVLGDTDDIPVTDGTISSWDDLNASFMSFPTNLPPGLYQAIVGPPVADLAGNAVPTPYPWQFWILGGKDSDQDGIPDDIELALGLNPENPDSNGNGVLDGDEDFDRDGLSNKWEVLFSLDPRNADSDANGTPDSQEDPDNDRLTNAQELALRTNPNNPDTDGDGWSDEAEVSGQGDPLNPQVGPRLFLATAPPLTTLVTGPGQFQPASRGTIVAVPPMTVLVPGLGQGEAVTLGSTIANPPLSLLVSGPVPSGSIGVGVVIAPPPLTVLVPGLAPFDAVAVGTIAAKPPVTLLVPGFTANSAIGIGTVSASPPVGVLVPGASLEVATRGFVLAQPPVAVGINTNGAGLRPGAAQ